MRTHPLIYDSQNPLKQQRKYMPDTVIDYMQSNRPINRLCHSKQDRKYNTAAHIYEKVCQDPTIIIDMQDSK